MQPALQALGRPSDPVRFAPARAEDDGDTSVGWRRTFACLRMLLLGGVCAWSASESVAVASKAANARALEARFIVISLVTD